MQWFVKGNHNFTFGKFCQLFKTFDPNSSKYDQIISNMIKYVCFKQCKMQAQMNSRKKILSKTRNLVCRQTDILAISMAALWICWKSWRACIAGTEIRFTTWTNRSKSNTLFSEAMDGISCFNCSWKSSIVKLPQVRPANAMAKVTYENFVAASLRKQVARPLILASWGFATGTTCTYFGKVCASCSNQSGTTFLSQPKLQTNMFKLCFTLCRKKRLSESVSTILKIIENPCFRNIPACYGEHPSWVPAASKSLGKPRCNTAALHEERQPAGALPKLWFANNAVYHIWTEWCATPWLASKYWWLCNIACTCKLSHKIKLHSADFSSAFLERIYERIIACSIFWQVHLHPSVPWPLFLLLGSRVAQQGYTWTIMDWHF